MSYPFFILNGEIRPTEDALISLGNIEYSYGFGVYENIRVLHGKALFIQDHIERLLASATTLSLEHIETKDRVEDAIALLLEKNNVDTCNLKLLLVGGATPEKAIFSIQCLNPSFVPDKLYKSGVHCITEKYERLFPQAKTLNMLGSYLAYRKAKRVGAHDALLLDRKDAITEGTRTNLLALQGNEIISPSENDILLGVTRKHVLTVAQGLGFSLSSKDFFPNELSGFDAIFLTSTSSKILPIATVNDLKLPQRWDRLNELMAAFNEYIDREKSA